MFAAYSAIFGISFRFARKDGFATSYWIGATLNHQGEWLWEDGTPVNIAGKTDVKIIHKNGWRL